MKADELEVLEDEGVSARIEAPSDASMAGDAKGMEKAWRAFIEEGVDPHDNSAVRPEVADSWVRCRAWGLDPFARKLSKSVADEEFEQILSIYQPVIDITQPLIGVIDDLGIADDYILELVARNGASLLRKGGLDLHSFIAPRDVFSEMTMGTNAHSLSMRHKRPFQLVGCEHYSAVLHGLAAAAAPIADENGVVIAALLLTQPLPEDPSAAAYQKLLSHALGLITSIASAIEYRLCLQHVSADLQTIGQKSALVAAQYTRMQHILDMTIDASSDPLLIVGTRGQIRKVSPEAAHILGRSPLDLVGMSFEKLFDLSWQESFGAVLEGGRGASVKTLIRGKAYMLRGSGIRDAKSHVLEGVLLRLEERARATNAATQALGGGEHAGVAFKDILGESPQIAAAIAIGRRYAVTAENVLVVGESGTGKELFAQAIHNESRSEGPFMSINCAAIPPRLIESELFGYESGAFTGAERGGKAGKIELAHGGTLFLDEIGDMPLELQATLLRVLENRRVMRLGGKTYKQVDFRVVAATNRDLHTMVEEGTFREDLLYRLAILTVELPPLREREGDAMFFAKYFLNECQRKAPGGPRDFSEAARQFIKEYRWPGNVRQVKNAIYSVYYVTEKSMVDVGDFPAYALRSVGRGPKSDAVGTPGAGSAGAASAVAGGSAAGGGAAGAAATGDSAAGSGGPALSAAQVLDAIEGSTQALSLDEVEAAAIRLAMRLSRDNVKEAASALGLSKATLYRKLKDLDLDGAGSAAGAE